MFQKMIVMVVSLLSLTVLAAGNGFAQEKVNLGKEGLVVGVGFVLHEYEEDDDIRKGTGSFSNADNISMAAGFQGFFEYFLNSGFAFGLKVQELNGGVIYSGTTYDYERRVNLSNTITYANFSIGFGKDSYLRLGGIVGLGASTYKYSTSCTNKSGGSVCSSISRTLKTSSGTMNQAGLYIDWGGKELGGRIGTTSVQADYPDLDGVKPKANGRQTYADIRYVF